MIERQTLARRIARHTGQSEVDVQYMFDNPSEAPTGHCWSWSGSTGGKDLLTPMMKYQGKPTPVRRVLVGPYSLVNCGNPFCVNPSHATSAKGRLMIDEPEPEPEPRPSEPEPEISAGAEPSEIDELLEMLGEGFTETQLLTMYEPGVVAEALRLSRTPL